jgi:CheY-like chemotaxis protein
LTGKRVLVVEDVALVAAETGDMLAAAEAAVVGPALSLEEGLSLAKSEKLDAALLDVHLGDVPVFAVADELARRGIPFVFLTGYGDTYDWPPAYADTPRLTKPARPAEVFDVLGIVMARGGPRPEAQSRVTSHGLIRRI